MSDLGIATVTALASHLAVNQSTASRWLRGQTRVPASEQLRALADFLELTEDEVLVLFHRSRVSEVEQAINRDRRLKDIQKERLLGTYRRYVSGGS